MLAPGADLSMDCIHRQFPDPRLVATSAGFINPALPLLIGGAVASAAVAGVLGNNVLLPKLKQLPEQSLQLETVRQKLLAQVRCFTWALR